MSILTSGADLGEPLAGRGSLDGAVTYTIDIGGSQEDAVSAHYGEWKVLILATIEQAMLDVVNGITDDGINDKKKPGVRADALAFFIDGSSDAFLAFCGVQTKAQVRGVQWWIEAMGAYARNQPGCPPAATDEDAIMWGIGNAIFETEAAWTQAQKGRETTERYIKSRKMRGVRR